MKTREELIKQQEENSKLIEEISKNQKKILIEVPIGPMSDERAKLRIQEMMDAYTEDISEDDIKQIDSFNGGFPPKGWTHNWLPENKI